jgi:hypothetical protein
MNTRTRPRLSMRALAFAVLIVALSPPASALAATNNAAFVSQVAPTVTSCGGSAAVSITMRNTGTSTWTTQRGYKLQSANPTRNTNWGPSTVALATTVAPGQTATFTWTATLPSLSGTYNFQWQMAVNTNGFGALSTNVPVAISCTLDNLFKGTSQLVEDTTFTVDRPDLFRNSLGGNGHMETSTVHILSAVPAYRMFYRTFVNPDGTTSTTGVPAGIALATSSDGNSWTIHNGGKPVIGNRPSTLQTGINCFPGPCTISIYAPTAILDTDGSLKIMYEVMDTGVNLPASIPRHWIEAATSNDAGLTWSTYNDASGKPLKVLVDQADWEGYSTTQGLHIGNVGTPDLVKENGVYHVSYHGFNGSSQLNRGSASGPSLTSLTRSASNPTLKPGTGWSSFGPGKGSDTREGSYVYRVYEAFGGAPGCGLGTNTVAWGVARSTNRTTWEHSGLNPFLHDRIHLSCGNDMPSWQVLPGGDPMVITTNIDYPLASQPTLRRYRISTSPTGKTTAAIAGMGLANADGAYWEVTRSGLVVPFGTAAFFGDASTSGRTDFIGITVRPGGDGYWLATATGRIYAYGSAAALGDLSATPPPSPIVGLERSASGNGYWLVGSDGRVYAFGDAINFGLLAPPPAQPIVNMVATPTGLGYWLVGRDGSIYAFGDALHAGGLPQIGVTRNDVVGMGIRPDGQGYWIVAADGRLYPFGANTSFYGSTDGYKPLPHFGIVGIGRRATGTGTATNNDQSNGYYLVAQDGGIVDLGNAVYLGHVRGAGWNL